VQAGQNCPKRPKIIKKSPFLSAKNAWKPTGMGGSSYENNSKPDVGQVGQPKRNEVIGVSDDPADTQLLQSPT
jgi:hypothetical protein